MQYVFIVTYGRSGSTLLQALMNAALGGCIRGENNGFMVAQFQAYQAIQEAKRLYGNERSREFDYPWYGIMGVKNADLCDHIRTLTLETIIQPSKTDKFCGFKEIRHLPRHIPDLTEYIDFMSKVFPGARFIFNMRNAKDTSQSGWWKDLENAPTIINRARQRFIRTHKERQETSLVVEYEKLLETPMPEIRRIANFIGVTPPGEETVRAVLDKRVAVLSRGK